MNAQEIAATILTIAQFWREAEMVVRRNQRGEVSDAEMVAYWAAMQPRLTAAEAAWTGSAA
jgi:hypothetical protein